MISQNIQHEHLCFICEKLVTPSRPLIASVRPHASFPGFVVVVDHRLLHTSRGSVRIFRTLDSLFSYFSRLPFHSDCSFELRVSGVPFGDLLS